MKRTEIEQLLPGIFQRAARPGTPLFAMLQVMETLQAPSEEVLEELHVFFDLYRTPDRFVPFLARWVDLAQLLSETEEGLSTPATFASGVGRLRELIAEAAYLSKWRGTAQGLRRFLETATGVQGFEIDEHVVGDGGQPRPFHIRVQAPPGADRYRALVEQIVEMEKPAYVTYELDFRS